MEEVIIIRVSNPNSGFMKQLERMIEKYECESRKVTSKKRCLTFEKIKIYPDYHQVILDEKEVTLTGKEFQILLLLAENRGQVFSKKRIYETIWKGYHQKYYKILLKSLDLPDIHQCKGQITCNIGRIIDEIRKDDGK